jgi:hypothetical protein
MMREQHERGDASTEIEEDDGAFSAPLGGATSGHLLFTHGVPPRLTIAGDGSIDELFTARLGGPLPEVGVDGGSVTIEYPRFSRIPGASHDHDHPGTIMLNASIPWHIEIRGGCARLTADLGGLEITEIELTGGIADARIILPRQFGATPIRVGGGISDLTIVRPEGVGVRADISGGVARMVLDHLTLDGVGELRLESDDYRTTTDRYELRVCGGASRLAITTTRERM